MLSFALHLGSERVRAPVLMLELALAGLVLAGLELELVPQVLVLVLVKLGLMPVLGMELMPEL